MNKEELLEKIDNLKQVAETLEGNTRVYKLNDISQLKIEIEGMSIEDIATKMSSISLPDISQMQESIQEASSSITSQDNKISAFNTAYGIIKTALNIII